MKIAINGQLIDTELIWQISPVIGNDLWGWEEVHKPLKMLFHSEYNFTIYFINKGQITLRLIGSEFYNDDKWYEIYKNDYNKYLQYLKELETQLNAVRDWVITCWGGNTKYKSINTTDDPKTFPKPTNEL